MKREPLLLGNLADLADGLVREIHSGHVPAEFRQIESVPAQPHAEVKRLARTQPLNGFGQSRCGSGSKWRINLLTGDLLKVDP